MVREAHDRAGHGSATVGDLGPQQRARCNRRLQAARRCGGGLRCAEDGCETSAVGVARFCTHRPTHPPTEPNLLRQDDSL